MIIFLDIETTGLDPARDLILEVAAIEVSAGLEIVRGFHAVIKHEPITEPSALMDDYVRSMHSRNGLLGDLLRLGHPAGDVWPALVEWLGEGPHTLAGDSVHFDRAFLLAQVPQVASKFSHRLLDVTALKIARAIAGFEACPVAGSHTHRAADDAQASLAAARWLIGRMT